MQIKLQNGNLENNRVIYFDILNILACVSVIFLHMNEIVHSYSTTIAWTTSLIFEVICFWAVPVFIMLSGATLLNYKERYSTKIFFKKRFSKVIIPWIIWSLIIYIINNKKISLIQFVRDFFYCKIEYVYWFFPLIIFLYCLIPFFSIFTERKEYRKILKAIVIFQFLFRGILYPICVIADIEIPTIFSYFININPYIIFLILGYLLSTIDFTKKQRIAIYLLGIESILIRYFYTFYFSIKEGTLNRDLFDYSSGLSVLLAVAVFIFIKNVDWKKLINKVNINPEIITKISSCSFGVYLIHMLVKDELTEILNLNVYSIWYRTIGAVFLYIICVFIVNIVKKIPIIKNIMP